MTINPLILLIVAAVAAAFLVASLVPLGVRMAVRARFVDIPEGRKEHDRPVPPIGGLVILPVFFLVGPLIGLDALAHWPLYLGLFMLALTGVIDDRADLSAATKLFIQIAVSTLIAASGEAVLRDLGHLFGAPGSLALGPIAIPFTVACFVFLINAMNMIDGVDGLAGGLSVVAFGWLAVAAALGGDMLSLGVSVILIGALAGFLVHNMRYPGHPRATVFLGDAGSMSLGLLIAYLAINVAQGQTPGLVPIGVALVILVPIVDAFALFIARLRVGRRAFEPGRDHIHHHLLAAGLRPGQVSVAIMSVMFVAGAIGVLGPKVGLGEGPLTFIWAGILVSYTFFLCKRLQSMYKPKAH